MFYTALTRAAVLRRGGLWEMSLQTVLLVLYIFLNLLAAVAKQNLQYEKAVRFYWMGEAVTSGSGAVY